MNVTRGTGAFLAIGRLMQDKLECIGYRALGPLVERSRQQPLRAVHQNGFCDQMPAYHDHPFCMFPFFPPSSNLSVTMMCSRYFMLL